MQTGRSCNTQTCFAACRFLQAVEAGYRPNPYHNNAHAAHVVQVSRHVFPSRRNKMSAAAQSNDCPHVLGVMIEAVNSIDLLQRHCLCALAAVARRGRKLWD
jgi:hypothetical protein